MEERSLALNHMMKESCISNDSNDIHTQKDQSPIPVSSGKEMWRSPIALLFDINRFSLYLILFHRVSRWSFAGRPIVLNHCCLDLVTVLRLLTYNLVYIFKSVENTKPGFSFFPASPFPGIGMSIPIPLRNSEFSFPSINTLSFQSKA